MKRKIYHTRLYTENRYKRIREVSYLSITKGDKTEQFVADIMKKFTSIEDVQVIGNTGNIFDIIYRHKNDVYRALQVKTLTKDLVNVDTWKAKFSIDQYPLDTLIVLVNEARDRFGLISYSKIKVKTLSFCFRKMNTGKYRHNKYNNISTFSNSLNIRSKNSSLYDVNYSFSESIKKEYDSLYRLGEKCKSYNIPFSRNSTNSSVIDCFINNKAVQCKYSSLSTGKYNQYCRFSLYKSNGRENGKQRIKSYNESDPLDYFIFEVGGTLHNPEKYKGYFCIIPKQILIQKGYISSGDNKGKKSISLCTPDFKCNHWCLDYWNTFNV